MMQFPKSRSASDDEKLMPLINVVFLLLIFFMLAGHITKFEPFVTNPPESASDAMAYDDENIVYVGADGQLALNGNIMSPEALIQALEQGSAVHAVHIKADGQVESSRVIDLMERLRRIGVQQINLLTVRPDSGGQPSELF